MRHFIYLLIFFAQSVAAATLSSPDGRLTFRCDYRTDDGLYYSLLRDGREVVATSRLGIAIDNHLNEAALAVPQDPQQYRGQGWCRNLRYLGSDTTTVDTTWTPPYGEHATMRDHYNALTLRFMKGAEASPDAKGYIKERCYYFNVRVRLYNEGLAFCYELPETSNGLFLHLTDELTEFRLRGKALCTAWAQGAYQWQSLDMPWAEQAERPLTIRTADGLAVSILEARLTDYVRTKFTLLAGGIVRATPHSSADIITPATLPWRVVLIADKMADLCNAAPAVVLGLNDTQAIDASWIKPGKVFRSDLNNRALHEAVDFAADRGMQYVHLDAGWYGPEMRYASTATSVSPERDFRIPDIVKYARSRGLGTIVYVNQRALYRDLDTTLDTLAAWGVAGVKFGFVQVGSQMWTTWLHHAIRECARRHLLVDIHDEYRPTGFSRTYPNLMTAEGVRGNEEMPTATHNVTLPFTRALCGPLDYTLCYYNTRKKTTPTHQLAMAVVYYSPLTFMYWYDKPRNFRGEAQLEFWRHLPTTWDDSRVLCGEPGEYIATARRSGDTWFVGTMNGDTARSLALPLTFLTPHQRYQATIHTDSGTTTRRVTSATTLQLTMPAAGGTAIELTKQH